MKGKKMAKILIIGAECSKNMGSAAMLISATKTLKQFIPKSNFTILSPFPERDLKNCSAYNIRAVGYKGGALKSVSHLFRAITWNILYKLLSLDLHRLINEKLLQEYANANIVIDLGGDSFSDDYGSIASINCCYRILLCKFLNKPIVIYAQSIGPFKNLLTKSLSKFCLNRVDLLIVRDEITKNYLQEIGVINTIHFTADSAFLLEASPYEKIEELLLKEDIDTNERPIIGISASQHIYDLELKKSKQNSEKNYILLMVKIVDYLIEKSNAQIIFLPHVTNDDQPVDDRFVAKKIYGAAENKGKIRLINNEYSPEELKGVIGQCDLFIGARMHANIAATSMCVPTLAVAYSHKSYGIMRMLGMEEYVLDFRTMTFDEMMLRMDDLWVNRDKIKAELTSNVKVLEGRALYNGELVKELLDSLDKTEGVL